MSGSMPFAWIERPDGVKYRAVVNRKAPLSAPIGMMVCTEPLPNERVPTSVARLSSCSATAPHRRYDMSANDSGCVYRMIYSDNKQTNLWWVLGFSNNTIAIKKENIHARSNCQHLW